MIRRGPARRGFPARVAGDGIGLVPVAAHCRPGDAPGVVFGTARKSSGGTPWLTSVGTVSSSTGARRFIWYGTSTDDFRTAATWKTLPGTSAIVDHSGFGPTQAKWWALNTAGDFCWPGRTKGFVSSGISVSPSDSTGNTWIFSDGAVHGEQATAEGLGIRLWLVTTSWTTNALSLILRHPGRLRLGISTGQASSARIPSATMARDWHRPQTKRTTGGPSHGTQEPRPARST